MQDDKTQDDQFQTDDPMGNPLADMTEKEKLPNDDNPPFSPPSGVQDRIDDTHQTTDTNIDDHEHYDEGIEGAAEVNLPGESADENTKKAF